MNITRLRIGILEGDDIGREIVPASVEISRAAAELHGVAIDWHPLPIGARALETQGHTLPPETMATLKTLDGWILGPIGHRAYPKVPNAINPHPILRKQFNLFANVRPTRSYPDIGCLHDGVDLVIVRENNEGFQPDRNMVAGLRRIPPDGRGDALGARHHAHRQPPRSTRCLRTRAPAAQAPYLCPQGHGVQAELRHVRRRVQEARRRIS